MENTMNTSQWKKYLVATVLVLGISGVGAAVAAPAPADVNPEEMRAKAEKIHEDHRAATDTTRQQLMVKEAELKGQMQSVNPDTGRIEALSKEIGELRGRLAVAKIKMKQQLEKEGLADMHRGPGKKHGPRKHGCDCPGGMKHGGPGKHDGPGKHGMGKGGMPHRMG